MKAYAGNEGEDLQILAQLINGGGYDIAILPEKKGSLIMFNSMSASAFQLTKEMLAQLGEMTMEQHLLYGRPFSIMETKLSAARVYGLLFVEN